MIAPPAHNPLATRQRLALVLVWLGVGLAFLLVLSIGSVAIPPDQVLTILLGGEPERAAWGQIVLLFRLPRALTALLAGAALGVAGLQMQTLFRNPLADPFVLGISSGASLGVALVVLGGSALLVGTTGGDFLGGLGLLGNLTLIGAASLGALAVTGLVLLAAQRVNAMTLLVLGLMIGYGVSALVSILLYFSIAERIQAYIAWTFGSFSGVSWQQLRVLAPVLLACLGLALFSGKALNALLLGEAYATSMGLSVQRARLVIVGSAAVLAGTVTAFCGPIGFLGVAVPHLCRTLLATSNHRVLLPACMGMGGLVALLADLVAQVPGSQIVLPLNAITALIGAPIVAWVILRQRNLREAFGSG